MKHLYTALLALFISFSASAQLPDGSIAPDFTAEDINGVEHNLYSLLDQGKKVIIDFSATWCGPCLTMAPIVEELAEEHTDRVKVVKMDVDQNPETARTYGISAIPTFIVFHEGKEVTRYTGSTSKRGLESMLEQVAAVKEPASTLPTPPNP